ncbi:serine protease [Planctomycetales bacterium]|nr:serine protease [Planctomycetales bacterium]
MNTFTSVFMQFVAGFCCFTAVCFSVANAETRTNWATEAYKKNCESVVSIQGDKIEEGASQETGKSYNGMGTGVIVDERGYIITNFHVVNGIRKIQVTTFDKTIYIAQLARHDAETDLAIIKISPRKPLKSIVFGRSNDIMPGESCLAIGNPYGYAWSVTDGRVSGINREVDVKNDESLVYRRAIQTTTEINPGNSGGPLINVNGEMIGINAAIRQGAAGIAFAIPVDQVVNVAAKLIGEIVEQSVAVGIRVSQVEPDDYEQTKRYLIVVDAVESNSPAASAGIQKGDYLTAIGRYILKNKFDFYRALLDVSPNEDIAFSIQRNGEAVDVAVTLNRLRSRTANTGTNANANSAFVRRDTQESQRNALRNEMARDSVPPKASKVSPKTANKKELDEIVWEKLGIRCVTLSKEEYQEMFPKLSKEFEDGGVLVKSVRDDSPMARGYVTSGDVIVNIHEWVVTSNDDIRWIGKEWDSIKAEDGKVKIMVLRDGQHYYAEIPRR